MDATATFKNMRSEALRQWRAWAATLADGGSPPPPLEILEAGARLSIPAPMDALESDAAAIREVRALVEQAARTEAAVAERLAADGGPAGVRERLSAARAECRRLERLVGPDPRMLAVGRARTEADKIRAAHPRAFPTPSTKRPQAQRTKGGRA
jgi:hypothetical protein